MFENNNCDAQIRQSLETMAESAEVVSSPLETSSRRAVTRRLSDVESEDVEWLWPNRIAIGKLTMISGDAGLGKSFITLDMAARVSDGRGWPDLSMESQSPGGVLIVSCEDDLADTIRPRLDAHKADVSNIVSLDAVRRFDPSAMGDSEEESREVMPNLQTDLDAFADALKELRNPRLVVIDPISAYMGNTDSHNNSDVRSVLAPLASFASDHRVAIVCVNHLRKGAGQAINRSIGSVAFVAACRAAFAVAPDPNDPANEGGGRVGRRLFLPIKNNIGNDESGLAYTIESDREDAPPIVRWSLDAIFTSADEALSPVFGKGKSGPEGNDDSVPETKASRLSEAVDWLKAELKDGPCAASELIKKAGKDGIAKRTLIRAKEQLRIKPEKQGKDSGWAWNLPIDTCLSGD